MPTPQPPAPDAPTAPRLQALDFVPPGATLAVPWRREPLAGPAVFAVAVWRVGGLALPLALTLIEDSLALRSFGPILTSEGLDLNPQTLLWLGPTGLALERLDQSQAAALVDRTLAACLAPSKLRLFAALSHRHLREALEAVARLAQVQEIHVTVATPFSLPRVLWPVALPEPAARLARALLDAARPAGWGLRPPFMPRVLVVRARGGPAQSAHERAALATRIEAAIARARAHTSRAAPWAVWALFGPWLRQDAELAAPGAA